MSRDSEIGLQLPYIIEDEGITLQLQWSNYFKINHAVLLGFVKWHLLQFLQNHNPYVIGLSEKLEKPGLRDLKVARLFWTKYILENETRCIYSQQIINSFNLSLDHFIPWSYVVHDRLWNIIPTIKSVNSAKSNSLPKLDYYIDDFCKLQYSAISFHKNGHSNVSLDDYLPFIDVHYSLIDSFEKFKDNIYKEMEINIRSAINVGFAHSFIL